MVIDMRHPAATWREYIAQEMDNVGDPGPVRFCTLTDEELDIEFDSGYGGTNGVPFTAWTDTRVYFPAQYDGAEWVKSVSRNPDGIPTEHIGA